MAAHMVKEMNSIKRKHCLKRVNNDEHKDQGNQHADSLSLHPPAHKKIRRDNKQQHSLLELISIRNAKLTQMKTRIAHLCTSIISHPQLNIKRLGELLSMLDIKSDDQNYGLVFLSLQKLVALAALEVFIDIIPNYRVSEKEEEEMNAKRKLKKETARLREYERTLIKVYRIFLLRLKRMVECIAKKKKSNFYDTISSKAKVRIAMIAVKCFSQLLITHPHFNLRSQIIDTLVPLMASKYSCIADSCCQTICILYKQDKLGQVSLEAVQSTAKLIKERNFMVHPKIIKTFECLKIKEVKEIKENKKMRRMQSKLMSKKEKKRNKQKQKLENQLLEVKAEESNMRRLQFHTDIINHVFHTYFRVLKSNLDDNECNKNWLKSLLSAVLEGLSKFAHLINVEFFDDLISIFYKLLCGDTLNDHQCLHSLQTIFSILSGDGNALNIDFQRFYSKLYASLLNINVKTSGDDIQVLLKCLDSMMIKRKKQLSLERVLAFIKRLSTICLQTRDVATVSLLTVIRLIMINHKQTDVLLDTEFGSGLFLPQMEDPQNITTNSTLLWEVVVLCRHHHPLVRQCAIHILNGCQLNELSTAIIKKPPLDVYLQLTNSDIVFNFLNK